MAIVAYVLIGFGAFICLLNWCTLFASSFGQKFVSPVPLIGALLLGAGLLVLPNTRSWAWVSLLADFGTLILLIGLPWIAYQAWSVSRPNLVHTFMASSSGRSVVIKLYRNQIAVITAEFTPPEACDDHGERVQSLGLTGRWASSDTGFVLSGYGANRQLRIVERGGVYETTELNPPAEAESIYNCLDGLLLQKLS